MAAYGAVLSFILLQHCAAEQTIRVTKCFVELKVVVALADHVRSHLLGQRWLKRRYRGSGQSATSERPA